MPVDSVHITGQVYLSGAAGALLLFWLGFIADHRSQNTQYQPFPVLKDSTELIYELWVENLVKINKFSC